MVDEMRYGPFICAYGIKMHDGDYKYNPAVDRLLDSMLNLERRRESLNKEKVPKQKQKSTAEKKIPDELAMLLETTKVSKEILKYIRIYTITYTYSQIPLASQFICSFRSSIKIYTLQHHRIIITLLPCMAIGIKEIHSYIICM